jgi:hypothetical protein
MLPAALFILSIAMLAAAMTRTAMLCYSAFAIPTPARIKGGRACPQSQGQISRIERAARSPLAAKIYASLFVLSAATSLVSKVLI